MNIPLTEPDIAKTNVRYGSGKTEYSDPNTNVRNKRILQSLLVRKNGQDDDVVAGDRRFMTVNFLESEGQKCEFACNNDLLAVLRFQI